MYPVHPMIVHVPIALLSAAVFFDLMAVRRRPEEFLTASFNPLVLGWSEYWYQSFPVIWQKKPSNILVSRSRFLKFMRSWASQPSGSLVVCSDSVSQNRSVGSQNELC